MKRLVASLGIILATSVPVSASVVINCQTDSGVTVRVAGFISSELIIHGVEIISPDKHWSTHNVDAEQMEILQSFSDGESVKVDLGPPNFRPLETNQFLIAKIRLFSADEGTEYVLAGTLQMPGVGVYALICEGP